MKLYESQENYLKKLGNKPYLWCEVGTGKTIMALTNAYRRGERKLLIVCPASVRDTKQWEQEIEKSGYEFDEVMVVGYSFLQKLTSTEVYKYQDYFVIFDEAHKLKNPTSKQGKGGALLAKTTQKYLFLSGTPFNNWMGFANLAIIAGRVRNKTQFIKNFCVTSSYRGFSEVTGYRHEDVLAKWWREMSAPLKAKDCVDLPTRQDIRVTLKMKDRKKYIDAIKAPEVDFFDQEQTPNFSRINWAKRTIAETDDSKLTWVAEKLDGLENALIFVNTQEAIDILSEKLNKAKIKYGVWSGKCKDDYKKHDFMIIQYQAGGTGLNLQKFSTTIFLSPCYSYQDFTQAVGRTYRNGQSEHCVFYQLCAKNTIDEHIYRALKDKKDFDVRLDWREYDGVVADEGIL